MAPNSIASIASPSLTNPSVISQNTFLSSVISSTGGDLEFEKVIWSSDGKYIAASYHDVGIQDAVFVWKAMNGSLVKTLGGFPTNIVDVSWSPDGISLAILAYLSTENGVMPTATIWNTSTWKKVREYPAIEALSWSPDRSRIAVELQNTHPDIQILDIASGSLLYTFSQNAYAGTWSPDGKYIACIQTGKEVHVLVWVAK